MFGISFLVFHSSPFRMQSNGHGQSRARPAAAPGTEASARAEQSPEATDAVPPLLLLLASAAGRGQAGRDEPGAQRWRHRRRHCSRPGSWRRDGDAGSPGFAAVAGAGARAHPPAQETAAPGQGPRSARCVLGARDEGR
uniref:Pco121523 n=1 Tax=Arundo donax TaxID=35708 RepID=A0A0A9CZ59_ARUDO